MGDWLRYSLFDKYFKTMGCTTPKCPGGTEYDSAHYLLSWYYAWGGATSKSGAWSYRIGASSAHGGYQNPLAAYALSEVSDFKPRSPNAARDWSTSLKRQLEFYRWLQAAEGGIGGGATNSWNGRYEQPPAGTPTFYGMAYDEAPVYHDPPSNEWFGFQVWSMDRVAQYYYVTGNALAKTVLDKWVGWVKGHVKFDKDGTYDIPSTMDWSGKPAASFSGGKTIPANGGLHVKIRDYGDDAGVASGLARTLSFYAAKSGDKGAQHIAKELLDRMWKQYRDKLGVTTPEKRTDYKRFQDAVYVPSGWKGKMPNGDPIESGATFLSIRSKYKSDKDWPKVEAYLKGGEAPTFSYHRFWGQSDIAIANAMYGWLFPDSAHDKAVLADTGSGDAAGAEGAKEKEPAPKKRARKAAGKAHSAKASKRE
jgi:Glycosyl hydrolase family 48